MAGGGGWVLTVLAAGGTAYVPPSLLPNCFSLCALVTDVKPPVWFLFRKSMIKVTDLMIPSYLVY